MTTKKPSAAEAERAAQFKAAQEQWTSTLKEVRALRAELRDAQAKASSAPTATQQKPSLGSVVVFRAPMPSGRPPKDLAGHVACVVDAESGRVNLTVQAEDGTTYPRHDVPYSEAHEVNTWGWSQRS
jgi:hypothetical protein